jgi:hypothetical protein
VQAAMASKGSVSAWIYGDNLVDSGGPGAINRDATRFLFRWVGGLRVREACVPARSGAAFSARCLAHVMV